MSSMSTWPAYRLSNLVIMRFLFLSRFAALVEQRQIDRVTHRAIAEIARMEVIAAVVDREHPRRMAGVAQRAIEVDDRVEALGLAQPFVDRLAHRLAPRVPGAGQKRFV